MFLMNSCSIAFSMFNMFGCENSLNFSLCIFNTKRPTVKYLDGKGRDGWEPPKTKNFSSKFDTIDRDYSNRKYFHRTNLIGLLWWTPLIGNIRLSFVKLSNSTTDLLRDDTGYRLMIISISSSVWLPKACWWDLIDGRNSCPGQGWSRVKLSQV